MDTESYFYGQQAIIGKLHSRPPAWIRALGYQNPLDGLYVIINLKELFMNLPESLDPPDILCVSTFTIISCRHDNDFRIYDKMNTEEWYLAIEGDKTMLNIIRAVPVQMSDNCWYYHMTTFIENPSKKKYVNKTIYLSGYMKISHPTIVNNDVPEITSTRKMLVTVSGDVENKIQLIHGPTFKHRQKTSLIERYTGADRNYRHSVSQLATRVFGKSKYNKTTSMSLSAIQQLDKEGEDELIRATSSLKDYFSISNSLSDLKNVKH